LLSQNVQLFLINSTHGSCQVGKRYPVFHLIFLMLPIKVTTSEETKRKPAMKIIRRQWPRPCRHLIALIAMALTAYGCATGSFIVGNWQALEGTGSVSFTDDGVFHAIDNQGMPVHGVYRLMGADGIQFEIRHGEEETEIIDARIIRAGERLTLTFPGENAVETYERIP
jgi:hypothetical protein